MTARRIIEVLRVSRFVPSIRDGYITVVGLAKTRVVVAESTVHAIDAAAEEDEEDGPGIPDHRLLSRGRSVILSEDVGLAFILYVR